MIIEVKIDDFIGEVLKHLVATVNTQGLTAEEYAGALLSNLLSQIWERLGDNSILN